MLLSARARDLASFYLGDYCACVLIVALNAMCILLYMHKMIIYPYHSYAKIQEGLFIKFILYLILFKLYIFNAFLLNIHCIVMHHVEFAQLTHQNSVNIFDSFFSRYSFVGTMEVSEVISTNRKRKAVEMDLNAPEEIRAAKVRKIEVEPRKYRK